MATWALACCLQHPAVSCVILGSKSVDRFEANARSAEFDPLRDDHPQAVAVASAAWPSRHRRTRNDHHDPTHPPRASSPKRRFTDGRSTTLAGNQRAQHLPEFRNPRTHDVPHELEADAVLAHPAQLRVGSLAARLRGRATTCMSTDEIMRLTRGE